MYCPQCGQQQVSDTVRFCSRCGFLLEGTTVVLASGGIIPSRYIKSANQPLSPRSKGVRKGAMLMLSTFFVVPILAILSINFLEPLAHIIVPLAAVFCFIGGLLRMLYALMLEDAVAEPEVDPTAYGPPPLMGHVANAALPPARENAPSWRRPQTAEIYQRPSVTENTTRLLDKEDSRN